MRCVEVIGKSFLTFSFNFILKCAWNTDIQKACLRKQAWEI